MEALVRHTLLPADQVSLTTAMLPMLLVLGHGKGWAGER